MISRRGFVKLAGCGSFGLAMQSLLKPALLMAQSGASGAGKNLVVINLLGGLDGLAGMPIYSGPQLNIVNTELRPSLAIAANQVIQLDPQNGISTKTGLHPQFAPLVNVAADRMKIIQGYGIPGDPGRSHDTCQIIMSLGATSIQGPDKTGFLARLMDNRDWETMQYWALSDTNASDTNTNKRPPVLVSDLDGLSYPSTWWEGNGDLALATELQQALLSARQSSDGLTGSYRTEQRVMHDIVSVVEREIRSQSVGNNSAGNYSDGWGIAARLRDAARILKAKATSASFGFQHKDTVLLMSQDGYDTHSDQANPDAEDWGLADRLGELASNLAVFYRDLEIFGILDNTVIVLYSEFGRTNMQNAQQGSASVGTDHGHASNTLVLGGPVQRGVIGDAPSASDLRDQWYNAIRPQIDYRDVFSEILAWMDVEPESIFTDPGYIRSSLGLIS